MDRARRSRTAHPAAGRRGHGALGLTLLGLAFAAVLVRRQRHVDHPLLDLELFSRRAFGAALALLLLGMAANGDTYLFVTLYLQQALGLSPAAP